MRQHLLSFVVPLFALACGSSQPKPTEGEPNNAPSNESVAPATEPTPPPAPVPGDPKEMAPDIFKSLVENETVRVFEATFKPGAKLGMHKHPEHAVYVISGGKLSLASEDGTVKEVELKPGEAKYFPATVHTTDNIGDTEVKLVVVEWTKKGAPAPEGKDPVAVGPKIYKTVLDDPNVRIMEITFKKGARIGKHAHPDHAVYVLSGGKLEITGAEKGAKPAVFDLAAGSAMFLPAQAHSAANKGPDEVKAVVFEIKP